MSGIAIIGLACVFPGAPDLERFWQNIVDGVDAITDVPPERWDPSHYDPDSKAADRFYCRRGGFIDDYASFDPLQYGIVPKAAEGIEPDQLLTLKIGVQALRDAGYEQRAFARERTGVIVGRGNYISSGVSRLDQRVRIVPQILKSIGELFPQLPPEALADARERLEQDLSYYGPDVAAGLIPNLIASRLANRLDLHGPAFTVDAACASAIIAVEQACKALMHGDADMMLVGGAHLTHDLTFWATFCQLGALSRSGVIRPLSADADGILASEGIGMAVLKRLPDAIRDGDRIYAVIEGCGSSSDGRGSSLLAPAAAGQHLALQRAWKQVPFDRSAIGLMEAHGTGTPTGDAVELETLATFFSEHSPAEPSAGPRPVLGSVKSMIGHAMPASGMASLIKTALSVYHGLLPPTLHCEKPHPKLDATGFRVIARSEPWPQPREQRVAAINAFGFGGVNAHAVIRGVADTTPVSLDPPRAALPAVLLLSADSSEQLLERFDRGENDSRPGIGRCRLALVAPDAKKLALARKVIEAGKPWHGRQQIWFTPEGLLGGGGKLAFLFPGVDSRFQPRAADLAVHYGLRLPPHCQSLDPATELPQVVGGLLEFNLFLFDVLGYAGIRADVMAGHCIGEWSALAASGMVNRVQAEAAFPLLELEAFRIPDLPYLAAACSAERLRELLAGVEGIELSHDNCPHQSIACGTREAIVEGLARLRAANVLGQMLPFVAGFHSPLFEPHAGPFQQYLAGLPMAQPATPLWSCATAASFPATPEARCEVAQRQVVQAVRFRPLVDALYDDGCRVFVQVGTGSLSGFVHDTLGTRPHLAMDANVEGRSGLEQLQQLSAALWVEGAAFDTALLVHGRGGSDLMRNFATVADERRLALGVPLLRVHEPSPMSLGLSDAAHAPIPQSLARSTDPVARMFRQTLVEIEQAGRDVAAAWQQRIVQPAVAPFRLQGRVQRLLDLDSTIPWVRDHQFYPQQQDWPIVADGRPVVPMTMEVMLVRQVIEEALEAQGASHLKVIEVGQVQAYSWLDVASALSVDIVFESVDADQDPFQIKVEIVGYFKARVTLARDYPSPPEPLPALENARPAMNDADQMYRDRWMFHGPAYQGVTELGPVGDNGIDGRLLVSTGQGALLDNSGQLAGYWVMEQPSNCLAMPIGVDHIRFYAPDPEPGERLRAQVRITKFDALSCVSDHRLVDEAGRTRLAISGWRTRRYDIDRPLWDATKLLGQHEISRITPDNLAIFDDVHDSAIMRDYLGRRYLSAAERQVQEQLSPRRKRAWLSGRIAAKDAVRAWLRRHRGASTIYPQEVLIDNDVLGAPQLRSNVTGVVPETLRVSISHRDRMAVAIAAEYPVGIDIERIEPREPGFVALVFSTEECAILIGLDEESGDGTGEAVALTRGWVAKEACAKALGTGLQGRPRDFVIEARAGDQLKVSGRWVSTCRFGDHMVGWTRNPADSQADILSIS